MDQLFSIERFTEKQAEELLALGEEAPRLNDYEELIVCLIGTVTHFIDFDKVEIEAPFVSFVTKRKPTKFILNSKDGRYDAWIIRFKSEFIPSITFHLYLHFHGNSHLKIKAGESLNRISALCEMMYHENINSDPDYAVIQHLLSTLFIMIESEQKKLLPAHSVTQKKQYKVFIRLLRILEENYHKPEGVEFYAGQLSMSSRNLNLICKDILNQSVSEIIETRKLIEAKNLLIGTDKTISEIGFELGYNESSYFTSVFKRKSGQSPTEFREDITKLLS